MIYYKYSTGTFVVTEPRPWAKENQELFPDFDFADECPTTNYIEKWLIENRYFQRVLLNNPNIKVIQNLDPDLFL